MRGQLTVAPGGAAEELPLSAGQGEPRNSVRREPWQGPRNDTAPVNRMIRVDGDIPGDLVKRRHLIGANSYSRVDVPVTGGSSASVECCLKQKGGYYSH